MISSFDLNFDVLSDMMGIVVEKKNPAPKEGESLQIYIPKLMPNLSKSIPSKQTNFINKGTRLFLNAAECRPRCRNLFKTQNYITGYLERTSEWINVNTSNSKKRNLHNLDGNIVEAKGTDSEGKPVTIELKETYRTYYTVGGEKVSCYAPNGKFSKLLFNIDKYF